MENTAKKPPYYRTVTVKHQILEKAEEDLIKRANAYEREHTVLHRSYTMAYGFQSYTLSILFCCETKEGEAY